MLIGCPALLASPLGSFFLGRQPAPGRELVDHLRQMLAQLFQQFVAWHPGLLRKRIDGVGAERLPESVGLDLLVWTGADPGLRGVAVAAVLQILEDAAE